MEREGLSGVTMAIFDLKADLLGEEEINPDPGARRCSLRQSFLQRQVGADAYIGAVDDSIRDTHL